MPHPIVEELRRSIEGDDVARVTALLERNRGGLEGLAPEEFCSVMRIFGAVRSNAMADALLDRGVTVEKVSAWWGPGFGLEKMPASVAEHLLQRGAVVTPHAAAALGLVERLRALLDRQPELVHAKGGDGARPLHFSRNVETARLLVARGAEIDPRDDDHDSTPAQWRIGDAPEVTGFLLEHGARPDIFMAVGLGDLDLARRLVAGNPECTTYRIGNNRGPFPGIGFGGRGGTIYQWTLGFNRSPQELARLRGHEDLFEFLMSHTPPREQLLVACMLADRPRAEAIARDHPGLVRELEAEDQELLAKSCWETNLNCEAVRLMLDLGFPIDVPERNHGFQALHNAAWCGDAGLVSLLLARGHPLGGRDPQHQSTALGFAIHSCTVGLRHPEGDFPRVVGLLLEAGVPLDEGQFPTGNDAVDAVIRAKIGA